MSIRPDRWIRERAMEGMIEPFEDGLVREGVISYGLSSFGYDLRAAPEWRIFVNAFNTVVDPKNFDTRSLVESDEDICIIPPNSFVLTRSIEYLRIPDDTMVVALGKSSYARCFSADTRVALVDGTAPTLEELASRHAEGGQSWGYSIGENGRLQMALLDAPRFVGRDSLVEITLDDGATIEATPDHEFMRRDGSWTRAGDLEPLDSLMPLYRMSLRGYEMVYQPRTGRYSPTHGLADAWNLRNDVYAALPESQRHHVDQDRRNNNPWNVVRMAAGDHIGHHDARSRSETFDPVDHTESVKDAFRRRSADPGGTLGMRAQQAARARSSWYDETYAARRTVLGCDRSVSRGFPEDLAAQRGARDGSVRATSHPDPKLNHAVTSVRALKGDHDVYCLSVPEAGNFALEAGVFVSNCGIVANVTPLEPGWEGHVTLELSNTTPLPAKVYANEGIVQLLFFQGDRPETTYRDRKGKYQGQKGVTLPRI